MATGTKTYRVLAAIRVPELAGDVLRGIAAYVREQRTRWHVRFVDVDEFPVLLLRDRVDGAIAAMAPYPDEPRHARRVAHVRRVNVIHDLRPQIPSVLADERATGRMAARYLIGRGYQNFAYIGYNVLWSNERKHGFAKTLEEAGHRCHECHELSKMTHHSFLDSLRSAELLREWISAAPKPIGVLVCSDHQAASALQIMEQTSVRIPEQVGVLGVGDLSSTCELAPVPLSSVAMDFPAMGYQAAKILDGLMSGGTPPAQPCLIPPAGVVTRRSTDAFMFDDEYVKSAMRIIHDRGQAGLTLKELMRQIPVSRQWLDRQFKELVGHTASREMHTVRLERVRELLLNTDLTVQEIATLTGFSQAANLVRFFRHAYGTPPMAYRLSSGPPHPREQHMRPVKPVRAALTVHSAVRRD